jgi:uncharacterized membrane protein HdeD (DUF308 family)
MTYQQNPAKTAGPNADGSKSLAKESRWGLATSFIVFTVLQSVLDGLTRVDLSGSDGWWVPVLNAAIAAISGLIAAYLKKNR